MSGRLLAIAGLVFTSLLVHADATDPPVGGPATAYQYSVVLELGEPAGGWSSQNTRVRLRVEQLLAAMGHGEVGGDNPQPFSPLEPGFGSDVHPDWDTMEVVDLDAGTTLSCLNAAGDRQCTATALRRGPNLFAGATSLKMKQTPGKVYALADWPLGTTASGDPVSLRDVVNCPGAGAPSLPMIDRGFDCNALPPGIDPGAPRLAYRDPSGEWLDPNTLTYPYGWPQETLSPAFMVATPGDTSGAPDPIVTIDHNLGQWQTGSPSCFVRYEIDAQPGETYSFSYKDKTASVGPCGDTTSATKIRDDLVATINASFPAAEPIDQPFATADGETGFNFAFKGAEGFAPPRAISDGIEEDDRSYCLEQTSVCSNDALQPLALIPQLGDAHPSYYEGYNDSIVSPNEHRNIPYLVQYDSGVSFTPGMDTGARWLFRIFPYSGWSADCGSFNVYTHIGRGPGGPAGVDRYQESFVVGEPHCFRKMDMLGLAWGTGQTRLGNIDLVRMEPWLVLPPSASTTRRVRVSWNPANARNEFANLPVVDENLEIVPTTEASFDASETRWVSPHSYTLETAEGSPLSVAVTNPRVQLGREAVFPDAVRPRARVAVARNEFDALQLYVRSSGAQSQVVTGATVEGGDTSPLQKLSANGTPAQNGTSYFFEYPNLVNARGDPFVGRIVPSFLVRTEAYLSGQEEICVEGDPPCTPATFAVALYGDLKNAGQYRDRSSAYVPFTGGNKLTVPAGEAGGVRLLVKPSLDLLPSIEGGVYSGTLQIALEGVATPVEVPIEIEVFEMALPLKPAFDNLAGEYRYQAVDPAMWHLGIAENDPVPADFSEFLLASLADHRVSGFLEGAGAWYQGTNDDHPYRPLPNTVVHDGEGRFAVTQKFTPSSDGMDSKLWQHEIDTYQVPHAGPAQAMDAHGLWQPPGDPTPGRFYTYSLQHNWNALGPIYAPAGSPSEITGSERCDEDRDCGLVDGAVCIGGSKNPTVWGQCTPLWYPVRAGIQDRPWWETVQRAFHKQLAAELRSSGSRDVFSAPHEPYWYIDELRYVGSACAGETMEAYADGYVDAYNLAAPYGWKGMLTLDYAGQYELWRERALREQDPVPLRLGFQVYFATSLWAIEQDLQACEDEDPETPCPFANVDAASTANLSLSAGDYPGTGFYAHNHRVTGTAYGAGGSWLGRYMAPSCAEFDAESGTMVPVVCSGFSTPSELGSLAPKHRLEHMRDASEDYDYVALLKTRKALADAGNLTLPSIGAIDESLFVSSLAAGDWVFYRPVFVSEGVTASVTLEATTGTASLHVRANGVPSAASSDPDQCDGSASQAGPTAVCSVTGPAHLYVAVEADATGGAVDAQVSIAADAPAASPYADVVARNLAQMAALSSGEDDPFNWLEANKRLTTDMDALQSLRNEIARSFELFVPIAGASGGGLANACTDASDCDDHNDCTDDICNPMGSTDGSGESSEGCQHVPKDGTSCSDGNACTASGTCQTGVCVSQPLASDDNYCTFDALPDAGSCGFSSKAMDGITCQGTPSGNNPSQAPTGVCIQGACWSCEVNLAGESCSDCTAVAFQDGWSCLCDAEGGCVEGPPGSPPPIDVCTDTDLDGIPDDEEIANGTDHENADTDGDGLNDNVETGTGIFIDADDTGTDPSNPDTDGDGLFDGAEVGAGMDPHTPDIIAVPTLWPLGTASLVLLMLAGGTLGVLRRR